MLDAHCNPILCAVHRLHPHAGQPAAQQGWVHRWTVGRLPAQWPGGNRRLLQPAVQPRLCRTHAGCAAGKLMRGDDDR